LEGSDWRTSAHIPKENQRIQDEVTPISEDKQEEGEESEQENVVVENTYDDDGEESIASGNSDSTEQEDNDIVTTMVSTFRRVQYNEGSVPTNVWENQLWEQPPTGELYKVSELTPVYGCSMGLRSDFSGCRYCLCEPCRNKQDEGDRSTRTKRGAKTLKQKFTNKEISCDQLPQRHSTINLVKEYSGSYFKQGGAVDKSYPTMCCGCLRPFTG
jgi:hypothetical protein